LLALIDVVYDIDSYLQRESDGGLVTVKEKEIESCILLKDNYVYFDAEGLVLRISDEYDGSVPLIEGVKVKQAKMREKMKVENE
jgi:SHS2 domain-containing protein